MSDDSFNYPIVKNGTQQVRNLLLEFINHNNSEVELAITEMITAGGKMLRPAMFLLFNEFGNQAKNDDKLIKIAASLEILHMATLIHDDIVDDSPLRRGVPSIQTNMGKDIAVYAGDLLFTKFFQLINETMNGTEFMQINANAMEQILTGELVQKANRFNYHNPVEVYLDTVSGKTAELFRLACLEGAHFGGAPTEVTQLASEIGQNIGIAFQINDDILDYTSDPKTLKKPILEDLSMGVYTLPLLLAIQTDPTKFEVLTDKNHALTASDVEAIVFHVKQLGGLDRAVEYARSYTNQAEKLIAQLPAGQPKIVLAKVIKQMLTRKY
ncbi:hypothetical protein FC70_GL001230 [Paucilactobacillus oligofermentans DSM 15707 = LMG 22743]|uniref:Polyprenyl synthetase family protein n=1 Tax=Paucilactobacillus oligofermentans DSM 15707 = LMG 22743 TaxID=1423778 RepID=A0A0R1RFV0_9LACO|nr:polyprenyl synthetase family protein [Paucilactobacillus oligofermentans]KRL55628.1 hypothetical protein FC70_GL001230 [Paucilactobacillus oligofermentans DSM 15707 = LMG 22743]CUS25383.1 Heptaprenyl diphosphate synthase component [Paucilactobacillus oligofermentans DSM 15707 = LMG 22743]